MAAEGRGDVQHVEVLGAIRDQGAAQLRSLDKMTAAITQLAESSERGFEMVRAGAGSNGKSGNGFNYQNLFSFVSLAFGAFMFVWTQIGSVQTTLTQRMDADVSRITSSQRELKTDVAAIDDQVAVNVTGIEATREKVKEIETQIQGRDIFKNTRIAHDERLFSILWQEVFKRDLPAWGYYPPEAKPGSELGGNGHR